MTSPAIMYQACNSTIRTIAAQHITVWILSALALGHVLSLLFLEIKSDNWICSTFMTNFHIHKIKKLH